MRTTFATSLAGVASYDDEPDNDNRIALFLDVDGTLLDFAERPENVTIPAGLVASIAAAQARTGGALALVSGRTIADLDKLFAPLRLRAAGVQAIFGPGTNLADAADEVLRLLGHNRPPVDEAAE